MPELERCKDGQCDPCACKGMSERPHCMYCLNDIAPEVAAEWERGVKAAQGWRAIVDRFAQWYYYAGNIDNPHYHEITAGIEADMREVLGAARIAELDK